MTTYNSVKCFVLNYLANGKATVQIGGVRKVVDQADIVISEVSA
ncbi:hypothetical protein [Pseudoalteromonas sp. MEBiC 03485]|nr:hypothetical protein [Pseudoalteromonas sp. MEBiC 03485]